MLKEAKDIMLSGNQLPLTRLYLKFPDPVISNVKSKLDGIKKMTPQKFQDAIKLFQSNLQKIGGVLNGLEFMNAGKNASKDIMDGHPLKGLMKLTGELILTMDKDDPQAEDINKNTPGMTP